LSESEYDDLVETIGRLVRKMEQLERRVALLEDNDDDDDFEES
jgi:hypothetical protein